MVNISGKNEQNTTFIPLLLLFVYNLVEGFKFVYVIPLSSVLRTWLFTTYYGTNLLPYTSSISPITPMYSQPYRNGAITSLDSYNTWKPNKICVLSLRRLNSLFHKTVLIFLETLVSGFWLRNIAFKLNRPLQTNYHRSTFCLVCTSVKLS